MKMLCPHTTGKTPIDSRQMRKAHKVHTLSEINDKVKNFDVIAIDEGQFFTDVTILLIQIANYCLEWADMGKVVIVAALDATFERKVNFGFTQPFGHICELVPMAESISKLSAVCLDCKEEAHFTYKHSSNKDLINDIGGIDKYIPVCRQCFNIRSARELNPEKFSSPLNSRSTVVDSPQGSTNSIENSD